MEPNETQHNHLTSSYFITTTAPANTTPSATNGILLSRPPQPSNDDVGGVHLLYPHSSSGTDSPVEPAIRRRGRPRKYGTPEQALAAKKSASNSLSREAAASSSSNFQQSISVGNAGQSFTPHIISVAAGEDVAQKIFLFMQQNKREMCILSASGSISNASLRQPATSGGSISYEGRFEIITLSGSYVRTDLGGRTGGISVCLSSTDGQIIGGGIDGPLIAGGPVQVIVGTFVLDNKKDAGSGVKVETPTNKLPSPVGGASISNLNFCSPVESSGRNLFRGNDDHQTIGGNPFMIHPQGMHDWIGGPEARTTATFDLTGRTGHGAHQSPENGDYEQYSD